jgi:hypothetical protein
MNEEEMNGDLGQRNVGADAPLSRAGRWCTRARRRQQRGPQSIRAVIKVGERSERGMIKDITNKLCC